MSKRTRILRPALEDWLALRQRYIGASEIAAVMGEHPFLTGAELAARKLTGTNSGDNRSMSRGRYLESAVAQWWGAENEVELTIPEDLFVYNDYLLSTLDRLAGEDIIEIKTTSRYCSIPPAHWVDQVQTQMLCTGLERAHLVVLDASLTLTTFTVEADPVHQMTLFRAAAVFLDCIRNGEVPPSVDMNYKAATILHPEPTTLTVELDLETVSRCEELRTVQHQIKELERDEDTLKGSIGDYLGDAAEGTSNGNTVVTWRTVTRTGIDTKRLRAELPEIAGVYRQDSTYRQLRLVQNRNRP